MNWLMVFLGGGLGSLCRFGFSRFLPYSQGFPWSTFFANLCASFLLGLFLAYEFKKGMQLSNKLFLMTGFCGGFSTFSTFSAESFALIEKGNLSLALIYILSSIVICLVGVFLGYTVMRYV